MFITNRHTSLEKPQEVLSLKLDMLEKRHWQAAGYSSNNRAGNHFYIRLQAVLLIEKPKSILNPTSFLKTEYIAIFFSFCYYRKGLRWYGEDGLKVSSDEEKFLKAIKEQTDDDLHVNLKTRHVQGRMLEKDHTSLTVKKQNKKVVVHKPLITPSPSSITQYSEFSHGKSTKHSKVQYSISSPKFVYS